MSDEGLTTLRELRRHSRKVSGDHEGRIADLERDVDELLGRLREAEARLTRRTRDVATLARVVRVLADRAGVELAEAVRNDDIPTTVPEPEPG